jgi:predicted flavoprotein YhiN
MGDKPLQKLKLALTAWKLSVKGKSPYKEEFVTCGGVDLKGVNFKTMESKVCPDLFFAGEVLNVDGITGGFNFQAAWTAAYLASGTMAERLS